MARFCRYWRMTPRDVDALSADEYAALVRYANRDLADQRRNARKRR